MIIGIGVDTVSIERVKKACERPSFINRCYTSAEKQVIDFEAANKRTYERAAGNFAVKEAVSKALGCGMNGLEFIDVESLRHESGAPYVNLYGTALLKLKAAVLDGDVDSAMVHVSITNTESEATAFVIIENEK